MWPASRRSETGSTPGAWERAAGRLDAGRLGGAWPTTHLLCVGVAECAEHGEMRGEHGLYRLERDAARECGVLL